MGLLDKILGGGPGRSQDEYLDAQDYLEAHAATLDPVTDGELTVFIAEISEEADVIPIREAVYDGAIVIADITRLRVHDETVQSSIDRLQRTAEETGGDIVRKGKDQVIITPADVTINRDPLPTQSAGEAE